MGSKGKMRQLARLRDERRAIFRKKSYLLRVHDLPVAEFAKQFVITEIMPELCNVYYKPMELSRATEVGVVYSRDWLYPGCGNNSMRRYLRRLSTYRRIYAFKCDNLHGWHETKTIKF